jgi:hypothetical protein
MTRKISIGDEKIDCDFDKILKLQIYKVALMLMMVGKILFYGIVDWKIEINES